MGAERERGLNRIFEYIITTYLQYYHIITTS